MSDTLCLGVIGLGRAFTLMLPTFLKDERIKLVAASDPRPDALARFAQDFGAKVHPTAEELCRDPSVQAIYVASPHQFHVTHVRLAAEHGKHVLVEKPMALSVADCQTMIAAAASARVFLLVGHSHSFDLPYLRTREIIRSDQFGAPRFITAMNYTDFLYRPRRPEELDTASGGGVVLSQATHQVDIVRLFANQPAMSLKAITGAWDPARPTEGAYNAQIAFGKELFASLTYSGYGRFDTDEFNGWAGELGQARDEHAYGGARKLLWQASNVEEEIALKNRRAYGPAGSETFQAASAVGHHHFGLFVVSCEGADLRPMPSGVMIYADDKKFLDPLPAPAVPRREVIDELYAAVIEHQPPLHSGEWGLATLEICLVILESARNAGEIQLSHQI
jgi:phthalate 4,5-cis-dihydrodiol dehydrogenase